MTGCKGYLMGTYMGNVGHLMQHWTLCEILAVAKKHYSGLNYIDAHAMAPWATQCAGPDGRPRAPDHIFRHVRNGLPGQGSVYERAWNGLRLANQNLPVGYPSSAAFVEHIWNGHGPYSMLLCETNPGTVAEIQEDLPRANLFPRDWMERFEDGLPSLNDAGLSPDSLTLVSFDPDMYSVHPRVRNPRYLYQHDLGVTVQALARIEGPVLIQLSTYSAQNNPQGEVIASVNAVLYGAGFVLAAVIRGDGHMMSLVYARGVEWKADLAGLPHNFNIWLDEVMRQIQAEV